MQAKHESTYVKPYKYGKLSYPYIVSLFAQSVVADRGWASDKNKNFYKMGDVFKNFDQNPQTS